MRDVDSVIARHLPEFRLPGVLSVRSGYRFARGWPVGNTPAIVVTVARKTSSPPGGALLPVSVEGLPVDVREASERKRGVLEGGAVPPMADLGPDSGAPPVFLDEIRPDGTPVASTVAETAVAAKPQLPYTAPADATLDEVTGQVTVQACASPDAGWPVLKAFLAGVEQTLTIGLYDWTSQHVLDWFLEQLPGRTVRLVLDHPAKNPTANQTDEETVAALRAVLGDDLEQAWALDRADPLADAWIYPSAFHIKVAVADAARVWLSSGNWNNSNQPDLDPVLDPQDADAARDADRDWHVVIDSPPLAQTFEAFLGHDLAVAELHQRTPALAQADIGAQELLAAVTMLPAARTPPFAEFQPPITVTAPMTITPLLTPDPGSYAQHVQALIESATASLFMQFQYIQIPPSGNASPEFLDLIAAVVDRQQAGVDVRIVMSQYETQGYLEQLIDAGLDVATTVRIQPNVHNKGIVVDGAAVLVSSQNWSNAGTTANRDAGVIIATAALAAYFQTLFLHDWEHLAKARAAPD
jgi:hypothetical protein